MKSKKLEVPALPAMPSPVPALAPTMLQTEPEPLEIDLKRTAVVIIDMQNTFVSKGGFFDLLGADISPSQKIFQPIGKITSTARAKGLKVLYVVHYQAPDLSDSGGQNSPNWYKSAIRSYREKPEWRDRLNIRDTWGAEIVEGLKPQKGDIVIEKQRYSAFFATNLDMILKSYNSKYIVFTGVATNICVEASLRDTFYLEYFSILISDACASSGKPFTHDATISNVKACYGWVTTTSDFIKALG